MTTTNTAAIQSKAVRRVVVLQADASGGYTPVTIFEKRSARAKKGSRRLKPIEKALRRLSKSAAITANSYTSRHQRSNEKKRNGWAKDLSSNVKKATRTGRKRAKLKKLVSS